MDPHACEHCEERRKTFPPCTYTYDPIAGQGTECHCFGCSGAFMDPHEPYPPWVHDPTYQEGSA